MVAVSLRALRKVFDDGVVAVDGLDLEVAAGEFMVLLGPTGCGKSTVLRLLAGLETPTSGEVVFDGVPVSRLPPAQREVGMVFQNHALYPHLTVAQNIGFPLRVSGESPARLQSRVAEVARELHVVDLLGRLPAHLSGGEQQRVALARALVARPALLLLDEPMSNVDAAIRAELRGEIRAAVRRVGITCVYVTHDQAEAMSMADRLAVLRRGVLQQVGTPARVYADPDTVFVAAFLGSPPPSLFEAAVSVTPERVDLDLGSHVVALPRTAALAGRHGERVTVGVRALRPGDALRGVVRRVDNLGHEVLARVDAGLVPTPLATSGLELPSRPPAPVTHTEYGFYPSYQPGDRAPAGEVTVRMPAPARVRVGDELGVAVAPEDLLLFDRSGRRIRIFDAPLDSQS
ncbi:ABC transporter ATP-binding protein [Mangrovihabitans endophyticus]|uniref:Sugar ABC transporter ATP-binding protein n=1 Tax=Mangrovihabitans endophyticus TaxID=1751298 RepID=A0A8J3C2U2_9ACTN|nr:ABC transporter ATP-binding protein [Mangrovihabitans endophyticus]GGL01298.1 sugar ABC transporter ATP-binding protein [Mangrovihabitans endophyticus]